MRRRKKQYEKRIEEWNLGKKVTEAEKAWMLGKRKKRMEDDGKETNFIVRSHPFDRQRLDRCEKEQAAKRRRGQEAAPPWNENAASGKSHDSSSLRNSQT